MPPSKGPVVSPSLKLAVFAVDAVWYLTCLAAALAIAVVLVLWAFPQVRETLAERGAIHEGTAFSLPLTIVYSHPAPAAARTTALQSLRVSGHHDVILEKPFERSDLGWAVPLRLVSAAIALWMLFELRALMHAVKRGHPFDVRNPLRIRRIGYLVIASGLLRTVGEWASVAAWFGQAIPLVRRTFPGASVGYHVSFDWKAIFIGLVILAIGHAFDAGARLQNDQDLTV